MRRYGQIARAASVEAMAIVGARVPPQGRNAIPNQRVALVQRQRFANIALGELGLREHQRLLERFEHLQTLQRGNLRGGKCRVLLGQTLLRQMYVGDRQRSGPACAGRSVVELQRVGRGLRLCVHGAFPKLN